MKTSSSVRVWTWAQLAAMLVLLVSVGALAYYAIQTHDALCKFKGDLENRAEQTAMFVGEIESGKRESIPGISLADLRRSYSNQVRTLSSLSGLDCG